MDRQQRRTQLRRTPEFGFTFRKQVSTNVCPAEPVADLPVHWVDLRGTPPELKAARHLAKLRGQLAGVADQEGVGRSESQRGVQRVARPGPVVIVGGLD